MLLNNTESKTVQLVLTRLETKEHILQVFPSGSDIYLDSKWVGVSPFKITIDSEVISVQIKKEGYDDRVFFIDQDSPYYIKMDLNKAAKERDSYLEMKRMRFLNTFGVTLLSIPITAVAYSLSQQAADAYDREYSANGTTNYDELSRLIVKNNMQNGLFACSFGLNIILAIDTIIQAVEYVEAVQYFSD